MAFESSPRVEKVPTKKCILIGGLSDGLLPTPYTPALEQACHELEWSLVQPILSSSYLGFGNGDLERDSEEISALLWYLTCHRSGEQYALVGHSTGCQNAIHFLKVRFHDLKGCLHLLHGTQLTSTVRLQHGIPEMVERTKVTFETSREMLCLLSDDTL